MDKSFDLYRVDNANKSRLQRVNPALFSVENILNVKNTVEQDAVGKCGSAVNNQFSGKTNNILTNPTQISKRVSINSLHGDKVKDNRIEPSKLTKPHYSTTYVIPNSFMLSSNLTYFLRHDFCVPFIL